MTSFEEEQSLVIGRVSAILDRFGLSEYFLVESQNSLIMVFTKKRRAVRRNVLLRLSPELRLNPAGSVNTIWKIDTACLRWFSSWTFDWPAELIREKNMYSSKETELNTQLTVTDAQIISLFEGPLGFWKLEAQAEKPTTLFMLAFLVYSSKRIDLQQYEQYFGLDLSPEQILFFHDKKVPAVEAEKYCNLPLKWVEKLLEEKEGDESE